MSWTEERVERLKRMWAEGASASQIAKELGQVTRNAVIGKIHRLGLSNRGGPGSAEDAAEEALSPGPADTPEADPAAALSPGAASAPPMPAAAPAEEEPSPAEEETGARTGAAVVQETAAGAAEDGRDSDGEDPSDEEDTSDDDGEIAPVPFRRPVFTAGQPLPPQPSTSEISPEAIAKVQEVEKVARRLTLMELTEKTCKWPVGDPATPNFWFCGLPVQPGKPYCEAHVGVAFQPMSARRDRRR